jgi:hypothetical protein
MDPDATGLVCLEEPENGIHPERIPAMLVLLKDITVDAEEPVDETNPLRQVVVNTHSPAFVAEMPEDSLCMVAKGAVKLRDEVLQGLVVSAMSGTWRSEFPDARVARKGQLLTYLQPFSRRQEPEAGKQGGLSSFAGKVRRIIDRAEAEQMCLPLAYGVAEESPPYGK